MAERNLYKISVNLSGSGQGAQFSIEHELSTLTRNFTVEATKDGLRIRGNVIGGVHNDQLVIYPQFGNVVEIDLN